MNNIFHRPLLSILRISPIFILAFSGAQASFASEQAAAKQVINSLADYPPPPLGKVLHSRPQKSIIYQLDTEELGNRKPLILIHGGNGEFRNLFRWDKAISYFNSSPEFKDNYKIYLLRYDSGKDLSQILPEVKDEFIALNKNAGGKPLTIMALSMGGNLVQELLLDKDADQVIERVIALSTPFHGSPLFSADWFQWSFYKSRLKPITRVVDSLDYRIYFSRHHNYQSDLKWDNADGLVPQVGHFRSKLPLGPAGTLTLSRDSNKDLAKVNKKDQVNKYKIVAYGGYLVNPVIDNTHPHNHIENGLLAAYRFFTVRIPAQLGREGPALKVLNSEISRVTTNADATSARKEKTGVKNDRATVEGAATGVEIENPLKKHVPANPHYYGLNDGITPVCSSIFLSDEVMKQYPAIHEADLPRIAELVDVKKARVFRNIDHVSFVEGAPPHRGLQLVFDELHPEDGEHSVFEWMLAELLDANLSETTN